MYARGKWQQAYYVIQCDTSSWLFFHSIFLYSGKMSGVASQEIAWTPVLTQASWFPDILPTGEI